MSLDAYLYDNKLSPLSYTHLDLTETDDKGCTVDQQSTSPLGPSEFGARLNLPSPAKPVALFVDDVHTSPSYAPASIEYVNGKLPTRLDVVLYPLPKGPPSGSPPGGSDGGRPSDDPDADQPLTGGDVLGLNDGETDDALSALSGVLENPNWTPEESKGVTSLLLTVQLAYSYDDPGDDLKTKRRRWAVMLTNLGIIFIATSRRRTRRGDSTGEGETMGA